jgi:hypothetical protein
MVDFGGGCEGSLLMLDLTGELRSAVTKSALGIATGMEKMSSRIERFSGDRDLLERFAGEVFEPDEEDQGASVRARALVDDRRCWNLAGDAGSRVDRSRSASLEDWGTCNVLYLIADGAWCDAADLSLEDAIDVIALLGLALRWSVLRYGLPLVVGGS